MKRRLASAIFLASALYLPVESASALGLGKITVKSALNQPLLAEIPLRKVGSLSEEEIIARLASNAEFERFGVDRTFYHSQLRFRVKKERDGTAKLLIVTRKPVKEPFVDFVLETRWPEGRLIRNYTVLLDLPHLIKQKKQVAQQVTAASSPSKSSSASGQKSHSQLSSPSTTVAGDGSYQVQSGDSLWKIARNNKQQGSSINETMQALYELNPEAFVDGDRNKLKAGAVLRLPQGTDAGMNVGSSEAAIDSVPDKPQLEAVEVEEAVETLEPEAEDTGYLTLSSADEQATESELAGVSEEGEEQGGVVIEEADEPESEYLTEETYEDEAAIDDEPYQPPQVEDTVEDETSALELESEQAADVEETAEAEPTEQTTVADEEKSSLLPILLGVVGAAVLALLAFFFLRRKSEEEAPESPQIVPLGQREEEQEIEEEQELEEESVEDDVEEPAPETDAASEADIYIAYGRFDQAADVLTKALDADPDNEEVRLKLSEVYVDGKMKDEYLALLSLAEDAGNESLVIKMKALLDNNDEARSWLGEVEVDEEEESLDLDIGKLSTDEDDSYTQAADQAAADSASEEAQDGMADTVVDLDQIDLEGESELDAPATDDFTVDGLVDAGEASSEAEPEETLLEDFDLDSTSEEGSSLDNALAKTAEDEPEQKVEPEPEEPEFSDEEEVATKLELASAYIDMGDYDGARDILEEVLEEGNDEQKKQAQELLEEVD